MRTPGERVSFRFSEQPAAAQRFADAFRFDQALGFSIGRGEIDFGGAGAAARRLTAENSSMSRPAESMRAFDFPVRALGPRRSHSISRRTLVASASCLLGLRFEKVLALLQELAVVALHLERALRIDAD